MNYHQLHRSEVEEDLVDSIIYQNLKDGSLSSHSTGKSRLKKFNNVKMMAAIFKREMPGVLDGLITDCADTIVHRLDSGATEQTVEQLCLFLTTLLIAERHDRDNCCPAFRLWNERQFHQKSLNNRPWQFRSQN